MALIGYARVSSVGQSLAVQLDKLQDCDPIFQEKRSGTSDNRPQLAACLEYVRRGDTLVVTK
ncbi:MAG: recombinase family protein, partial [Herpetosiphonaceae bacterium]|nr:recombinase family protein [Herpetosiphonaceae bacterium]